MTEETLSDKQIEIAKKCIEKFKGCITWDSVGRVYIQEAIAEALKEGKSQATKEILGDFPELVFHESLDKLGFYYIKDDDYNKLRDWIIHLKKQQLQKL